MHPPVNGILIRSPVAGGKALYPPPPLLLLMPVIRLALLCCQVKFPRFMTRDQNLLRQSPFDGEIKIWRAPRRFRPFAPPLTAAPAMSRILQKSRPFYGFMAGFLVLFSLPWKLVFLLWHFERRK
jgi:hypothetical protein